MQKVQKNYIKVDFFQDDLNDFILSSKLKLNTILTIGGAGTIGSSYIKQIY